MAGRRTSTWCFQPTAAVRLATELRLMTSPTCAAPAATLRLPPVAGKFDTSTPTAGRLSGLIETVAVRLATVPALFDTTTVYPPLCDTCVRVSVAVLAPGTST